MDTIANRLQYAMRVRNMRNADIADAASRLGYKLHTSSITQYTTGKYIPKQDKIYILARCLNVPELWLIGVADIEDIDGIRDNTDAIELQLITNYRQLNKEGKNILFNLASIMASSTEYKKQG